MVLVPTRFHSRPYFSGVFDQRGTIILDTDPFVISFLYCVSGNKEEGAEKETYEDEIMCIRYFRGGSFSINILRYRS